MNAEMDVGTNRKAFQINLDTAKYGTFAEIGAGQEVARRFFHVGGAAGTVAKTMSAYDMTFSDSIYGSGDRYVSRARLRRMLDHEYQLLVERLDAKFGSERTFFVFADTVAARSFKQHNESHGWLGVRFQTETRGEPSEIIIHVR
ncbi:MAG: TonB-dependent receptor, partial [Verrucomicrobiota bacterium]|nr:TonB-dependent receptor [Verrucomicrobiota bacterium]